MKYNVVINNRKASIITLTAISTALVLKDIVDDGGLETWADVLSVAAIWLVVPYLNLLVGLLAKTSRFIAHSLVYSIAVMLISALYAPKVSTQDAVFSAQHMHVILIPPFLIIIWIAAMMSARSGAYTERELNRSLEQEEGKRCRTKEA